ncbi:hypothetical protein [Nocardiopsis flavescens]
MPDTPSATAPEPEPAPIPEPVQAAGPGTGARDEGRERDATAAARENPWVVRAALAAAAGLVVGGTAYLGVEVAAAFAPPVPAGASEPDRDRGAGERRTTPLLADPAEEVPEETAADPAAGGGTAVPDPGAAGGPARGEAPSGAGEGAPQGGEDPRARILHDILNTPQERPPLVDDCDQACIDARTAREEAGVEPVVIESHPEDHGLPTAP